MNRLKFKTALITGATSGIGKACAKKLAKKNVNLVLVARRKKELKDLKKDLKNKYNKINIKILILDVRNKEEVFLKIKNILKDIKIDILINNAGLALGVETLNKGNVENWEAMIDTNIKGLLYVTKAVLPHMVDNNNGHIVNLGSIAGCMTYPGGNVYCATKAAVHALNEAINVDTLGTNIRSFVISPGAVETNFSNIRFENKKEEVKRVYEGYKPLGAKDIADFVLYVLNTPEYVNIQNALIMPTAQRNAYLLSRK